MADRSLAFPSIGALHLTYGHSAQGVSSPANSFGDLHQSASTGSINAINLDRGDAGLELSGEVIQSVEHMFDCKTGV